MNNIEAVLYRTAPIMLIPGQCVTPLSQRTLYKPLIDVILVLEWNITRLNSLRDRRKLCLLNLLRVFQMMLRDIKSYYEYKV